MYSENKDPQKCSETGSFNVVALQESSSSVSMMEWTNRLGMQFRLIPAGSFIMGSPKSEKGRGLDEVQHKVILTQPFYMCIFELTQSEWQKVTGVTVQEQEAKSTYSRQLCMGVFSKGEHHPIPLSWNDAQELVDMMNSQYGDELTQALGEGWQYALPTEAQWEYACRAGSKGAFANGGPFVEIGWGYDDSTDEDSTTNESFHAVGLKRPNAWGLYDMHGNLWEWCTE